MDIERADNFIASLGLESYRVGGSVRDELLGRPVKDADYMIRGVSLAALKSDLNQAGKAARIDRFAVSPLVLRDGRQAGWRVSGRGLGVLEIVLPRTDVPREPKPGENRHRAFEIVVDPNVTLIEDARRRDFTFNALYRIVANDRSSLVAVEGGQIVENVLDPLGTGLYDLSHKLVRTTTSTSFRDDPLRTLRALRFVSVLGYDLATVTREQMSQYARFVTGLSANGYASGTVIDEMSKLLMGPDVAKALRLARDTGVLGSLFPELAPMIGFDQGSRYHDLTTDEHTFAALETAAHVDAPLRVRWSLLFHDSGKPATAWRGKDGRLHYYKTTADKWWDLVPECDEDHEVVGERIWRAAADRLGAPAKLRDDVALLIREHMVPTQGKFKASKVRRGRVKFGDEMLRDLYLHRACDVSGKGKVDREVMQRIWKMEGARQDAQSEGVPASVRDLAINGNDVMDLGGTGRQIGETLRSVLDEVVVSPSDLKRSREWQLDRASDIVTT